MSKITITQQTVALMAATIYAFRSTANPNRKRLDTLRTEAIHEAAELFEQVIGEESDLSQ